jgi:hypothetical protein
VPPTPRLRSPFEAHVPGEDALAVGLGDADAFVADAESDAAVSRLDRDLDQAAFR